ncbi:MAG: hypothetical protein IJA98_03315 [Bacteroidaceae bacterium]|nr:hypothetical protein [Bacteroidaceae bacterium]MBQ7966953.1 hypothetical protein [Bacteroidaceae bacterium]
MFALVDCNNFFCSVERVFCPGLWHKPVCVAGSNDGIIVALTQEAKALGLKRGDAVFKVRDIVERHGVKVFSTNIPDLVADRALATPCLPRTAACHRRCRCLG